ncbi:hypothetical protein KSX_00440 [Ktedonospora formicarum]|uniref:Uncharacterized protein n=1 Tax=Ktedonospora formicarum TaxID=2778364 RepID=A0A8J3HTV7_9CHLR|nr:hypothetical protein KSX_00440 [Ktedonospora formicarum]
MLKSKLAKHINDTQDSIRFYPLRKECVERTETVGGDLPKEEILFVV